MRIKSLNISNGGIPKTPVKKIEITKTGMVGDAHNHSKHGGIMQAISMIDFEIIKQLKKSGFSIAPGSLGENITLENTRVQNLCIGDVIFFEHGVILEISRVRKPCYVLDSISKDFKKNLWNKIGMYARVLHGGFLIENESVLKINKKSSQKRSTLPVPKGCVDGSKSLPDGFNESP